MSEEIEKLKKKVVYFQEMLESKQSMLEMTIAYMDNLQEELKASTENLEVSNRKLEDSINYAKRLQTSLLPNDREIHSMFPDSVVIFQPKFELSGDFYWFHQTPEYKSVAVIDCTGHGVPGAMLTVMVDSALNQIVRVEKKTDPSVIIGLLDYIIYQQLHKAHSETEGLSVRDGADVGIMVYNIKDKVLHYGGAHIGGILLRNGETTLVKGSRYSIGEYSARVEKLANVQIEIEEHDRFFVFSDGILDQFGGEENKKFGRRRLEKLIQKTAELPLSEQSEAIKVALNEWQGAYSQTDDMLLVAIDFEKE